MRNNITEVEKELKTHGYSINIILCDVMKSFKLESLCHQIKFKKDEGYSAIEILTLMIMLPLMLLKSVHALYRSQYQMSGGSEPPAESEAPGAKINRQI